MKTRFLATIVLCSLAHNVEAVLISIEPDTVGLGAELTNVFPGVTLSVEGRLGGVVHAADGFSSFNGRNVATTGGLVFGQLPEPSLAGRWAEGPEFGLLRADFLNPTDFVSIDVIFDDDDTGLVRAFDHTGSLLVETLVQGDGRGPSGPFCPPFCQPVASVQISRVLPDISYVVAGGIRGESLYLDNLQANVRTVPEPTTFVLVSLAITGLWRSKSNAF